MARRFRPDPIDAAMLDRVLAAAGRAPSAGNTQALDLVVLEGPATERYWTTTMDQQRRDTFAWPGLFNAPVLVAVVVDPDGYVARYGEADKARTGLGEGREVWPVPFWFVDGGAAIMAMLLAAADAGLGALLFGVFDHEAAVAAALGIPAGRRIAAMVALGHAEPERPSGSAQRPKRSIDDIVHRDGW